MAETLPGNSFIIKQSVPFVRPFFFGTTGQTVAVKLSKNGGAGAAAAGAVTEIDATNMPGWYAVSLTGVDSNTVGILAYHCTASSGGPADFSDFVQTNVFSDLLMDSSGRVYLTSNIKQNSPLNGFMFVMTDSTTHAPKTGLTVTAQRNLAGGGFAPCANPVSELSNGNYLINFAASDTNANSIMYRFVAPGADDLDILILTQP